MTTQPEPASLVERILAEGPLGISEAAGRLGTYRGGQKTHPSTLTRWAARGVRLADGTVAKLEAIRLNGRLATSFKTIERFIERQQPAGQPTPARTPAQRHRASAAAERELAAAG